MAPCRQLTCRYWAFGPHCPDDESCAFAHRDTGQLASHFQQRGTCRFWKDKFCKRGNFCFYEHRETGVPALYQGLVKLTGSDLQIADAAKKSGFNTYNHVALFDLIWSVKRVSLRESVKPLPQPPQSFRSGFPNQHTPLGSEDNNNMGHKRTYQEYHVDPPVVKRSAKRRKDRKGARSRGQVQYDEDQQIISSTVSSTPVVVGNETVSTDQKMSQEDDLLIDDEVKEEGQRMVTDTKEDSTISDDLLAVKTQLEKAQNIMVKCQVNMKHTFDQNSNIMSNVTLWPVLKALSDNMYKAHDESKEGQDNVAKAIDVLQNMDEETIS